MIEDVSAWSVVDIEAEGSDAKEWLADPRDDRWLCKPAVTPENGVQQGEDWSEWLAAEVATSLVVPHATILMATRNGAPAALSRSLRATDEELQAGAVLLQGVAGFVPRSKARTGHNLRNIRAVLENVTPPQGWAGPTGDGAAFGVFCGYLVFDALIANTDRHEENWAVIRGKNAVVRLCASYDHATSLGFNLSDERRDQLAEDPGRLQAWLERGTARRFEGGRHLTLVRHAVQALDLAAPWARTWWARAVHDLDVDSLRLLIDAAAPPSMSAQARSFAIQLVETNRRRLLDEFSVA
ncbi:MAG: hypothetical protein ABJD68_08115 [Nakamurella sp.]